MGQKRNRGYKKINEDYFETMTEETTICAAVGHAADSQTQDRK
jgi:hypothetical protein